MKPRQEKYREGVSEGRETVLVGSFSTFTLSFVFYVLKFSSVSQFLFSHHTNINDNKHIFLYTRSVCFSSSLDLFIWGFISTYLFSHTFKYPSWEYSYMLHIWTKHETSTHSSCASLTHTHSHWASAVCLILSVWVPSASFCSLLHSAVLPFSPAALKRSHYYTIHPLPPIRPPISVSHLSPIAFLALSGFSPIFQLFDIIFFLSITIYSASFPSDKLFSSSTSSTALISFFLFLCCHTFPPERYFLHQLLAFLVFSPALLNHVPGMWGRWRRTKPVQEALKSSWVIDRAAYNIIQRLWCAQKHNQLSLIMKLNSSNR